MSVEVSLEFKAPLKIDITKSKEEIMEIIMDAIEQSKKFMPGLKYLPKV